MFGYDGAECCSIVDVTDVAGEHTDLVAVSGSYEILDGVAHAIVATKTCHIDLRMSSVLRTVVKCYSNNEFCHSRKHPNLRAGPFEWQCSSYP